MVRCAGCARGVALGLVAVGTAPSTRSTHPPLRVPRVPRGSSAHFGVLTYRRMRIVSRIEACCVLGGTHAPRTLSVYIPLYMKMVIYTVPRGLQLRVCLLQPRRLQQRRPRRRLVRRRRSHRRRPHRQPPVRATSVRSSTGLSAESPALAILGIAS
jgi:hypothetical protein